MSAPPVRRSLEDTQPIPIVSGRGRHAAPRGRPLLARLGLVAREAGIVAAVALLAVLVVRVLPGGVAYVADDAMEPTLGMGDRVIVTSLGSPTSGDIVQVRGPEAWSSPEGVAFARVIAVAGQRVTCCDESGRVTVDGTALDESYVLGPTDQVDFDVVIPPGRIFVLADRRETARDSRTLLDVEEGTVALDDVIGRVVFIAWPAQGMPGAVR